MPTVLTPIPSTADSVNTDSVADAYYAPQYLQSGFPDSVGNDTAVQSMSTLPMMDPPSGGTAQEFVSSPLHDAGSMSLMLAGLMLVVVSYRTGYKYLENFFHNMFSTRRQESIFEDRTVNETRIQTALIVNTCIMEGLMIYFGIEHYMLSLAASLQQSITLHVCVFAGIALLFYLAQVVAYRLIGYVFSDRVSSKLWLDGFKASQSLLGLLLFPVVGVMLLNPHSAAPLLRIGITLYGLSRFVFIWKGFRIFYSNFPSILYFILYLCAVEIVPLFIVAWATVRVCGYLQL